MTIKPTAWFFHAFFLACLLKNPLLKILSFLLCLCGLISSIVLWKTLQNTKIKSQNVSVLNAFAKAPNQLSHNITHFNAASARRNIAIYCFQYLIL